MTKKAVLTMLFLGVWHMVPAQPAARLVRSHADAARVPVVVSLAVHPDGAVDDRWIEAIRIWHDDAGAQPVLAGAHPLSRREDAWAALIAGKADAWSRKTDALRVPFRSVRPPDTVYVILGNVGGQDAFTFSDSTIGFDLQRLVDLYGDATTAQNGQRIDRFFAHEFTHLMHKAWRHVHPVTLASPLDSALWECLVEGLGNYRSLSSRWVDVDGALTPPARATLGRLQTVFVDRLAALAHASDDEAPALVEGLSMGPFDQKWGALTVALWLAQEAAGDDRHLQQWVDAGPYGVLVLARRHLPEPLRGRLPASERAHR